MIIYQSITKMLRAFSYYTILALCVVKFVSASSTHKHLVCEKNEILSSCVNSVCGYKKCSEVGEPIECIKVDHKYCIKGCICKHKYLRADNGTCIPAGQCPNARKCPKPNEYYDACPPKCPSRTCAVMDNVICPEPLEVGNSQCFPPACRCKVGFYRDIDGNCVTWSSCNKCTENEKPTSCFQAICKRRNCSDLLKPVVCVRIDPKFCTNGCLCKDGFLRAENEVCVPINQCPEAQCGDNEAFDICPPTCPGEECGDVPSLTSCSPNPKPGDPSCQPRCRCSDGYLRNNTGKCIPKDKCRIKTTSIRKRPVKFRKCNKPSASSSDTS